MSGHTYEVNLPDYHAPDDWRTIQPRWPGDRVDCFDAEEAAERWCDDNFAYLEYPRSIDGLRVRRIDKPYEIETFDIEVESVPQFSARPAKGAPHAP